MVTATRTRAWDIAAAVVDPEIPVLTIEDLGVLRTVEEHGDRVRVELTPTYSGCPALDAMSDDVRSALQGAGYTDVQVRVFGLAVAPSRVLIDGQPATGTRDGGVFAVSTRSFTELELGT